jgi:WD40 repeat protein
MATEYTAIPVKKFRAEGFVTLSQFDNAGKNLYICDQKSNAITKINTETYDVDHKFIEHKGIIWSLGLLDNDIMISASGDFSFIVWEISTGNVILRKNTNGIPKQVKINNSENIAAIYVESTSKNKSNELIILRNITKEDLSEENYYENNFISFEITDTISTMEWNNEELVTGCSDGNIKILDCMRGGNIIRSNKVHEKAIRSLDKSSKFENCWLTSSLDGSAKEINIETFDTINTYKVDFPINVANYNYNNRKIYLGGGLDAMSIAVNENNDLTLKVFARGGKMKNIINGHFGPIRSLNFSKTSRNFTTAGQDGIVIVYMINDNTEPSVAAPVLTETAEKVESNKKTSEKEQFLDDIFSNIKVSKNNDDSIIEDIKSDTVTMSNLGYKAPRNTSVSRHIPGMAKTQEMIESEQKEKELQLERDNKRKEKSENNTSWNGNEMGYDRKTYGIKVFGLPANIKEHTVRDIFEPFGRFAGRGLKMKVTDKEFKKMNGKVQNYTDLMVIINYANEDSAIRAVNEMDKRAYERVLIDVQRMS